MKNECNSLLEQNYFEEKVEKEQRNVSQSLSLLSGILPNFLS